MDENEFAEFGFYTEYGQKLETELVLEASNILDNIIRKAEKHENNRKNDCSLNEYLNENFDQILSTDKYKNEESEKISILKGIKDWRAKYECVDNGCSHLDHLSTKYVGSWTELKGNQMVELKHGYKAIIDSMIDKVDSKAFYSKLKLKHSLVKILLCDKIFENVNETCEHCLYTNDLNKIILIVKNNEKNKNIVLICNQVICTMSSGYLKENFNQMFSSNCLNEKIFIEKFKSISQCGYGTVNKVMKD